MNNQLSLKISDLNSPEKGEVFEKIVNEIYNREITDDNILKFERPIRNLILIFNMHFEIMNGGLLQFIDNSTGDYFEETLDSLQALNASEFVQILNDINNKLFSSTIIPTDTESRRELIDNINESLTEEDAAKLEFFYEETDETYYQNEELLHEYVIKFTNDLLVKQGV